MQRYANKICIPVVAGNISLHQIQMRARALVPHRHSQAHPRKAIIAAWPKRHAAMQAHRKLGPWKAGETGESKP